MKKSLLFLLVILVVSISQTAFALPFAPTIPDDQPLFIKFNNYEQISQTQSIVAPSGATEQNWGILDVTDIGLGDLTSLPTSTTNVVDSQLFSRIPGAVWSDIPALGYGEITGIFYGITSDSANNAVDPVAGSGGFMDLYYDPADDFSTAFVAGNRTADHLYTGATDGTLLARIGFLNGAISTHSATTSVVGSVVPSPGGGFTTGSADSFGSIVDINMDGVIDASDGAWAPYLDTNFFDTLLGDNTADFRFKNSYNPFSNWDGVGDVTGAISDDPARTFSQQPIPEPGTILLFGLGLLGVSAFSRRRKP